MKRHAHGSPLDGSTIISSVSSLNKFKLVQTFISRKSRVFRLNSFIFDFQCCLFKKKKKKNLTNLPVVRKQQAVK